MSSLRPEHGGVMPIAIIGVAGRFPGDASSPEKLWDLIAAGRSAATEIPPDRFNVDAFYHPHNERSGTLNMRKAHYMQRDVDAFDAPFFSILPAEAKALDPQQRMALECAYEAFENAGIPMDRLVGTDTSCYVGSFSKDYSEMIASDQENMPLYHGVGTGTAILSNRISWFFDLHGPSISVDTACSSALVALHLGCQSLRTGESNMSIVGGLNFMMLPGAMINMASMHFLSPDGRCHSFDDRANGYSRGEGASFVVLKPLDQALRDRDMIRAIIRNTACGQDGNTPGITVPSGEAQEVLIRKCYSEAGLPLDSTQFVESHGTGTQQGDFREAGALAATLGLSRPKGDKLLLGSIKTNIGHLEGASGLAQVTKAVFMLEKAQIPPNLWYENPNPRIPMDDWNIKVVDELMPWPGAGPRRISINSFGYGGTNAHAIIDDAYHYLRSRRLKGNHQTVSHFGIDSPISSTAPIDSGLGTPISPGLDDPMENIETKELQLSRVVTSAMPTKLVIWSSNEQAGVERLSKQYAAYLGKKLDSAELTEKQTHQFFNSFVRTLTARRTALPWKTFSVVSGPQELLQSMSETKMVKRSTKGPKVAFVFTGQGAQWAQMGRELLSHSVFEQSIAEAGSYLVELGCSWSLLAELLKGEETSRINNPAVSQPVCTALQVALVDLLRYWGIMPVAVVGHSSGEIAAAYTKGAISRKAAWAIAYHRGRLSDALSGFAPELKGSMLACGLGASAAQRYIDRTHVGSACVACKNSPSSTTISGDTSAVEQIEAMLQADGVFARRLVVKTAYHSKHMEVIADMYLSAIQHYLPEIEGESDVQMFSSVTGQVVKSSDLVPSYWVRNMTGTVAFDDAVTSLLKHSAGARKSVTKPRVDLLLELGPHGALQGPVKQILKAMGGKFVELPTLAVLQRGNDAVKTSLEAAGRLLQTGFPVRLAAVNQDDSANGEDRFLVDLPSYAWNHTNKYWAEPRFSKNYRLRDHPRTDLLGAILPQSTTLEPVYRNILKLNEIPWIEHHRVQNQALYPAAGMMIAAIEAIRMSADNTRKVLGYELKDVVIGKAIVVPDGDVGVETILNIRPWRAATRDLSYKWNEFKLMSSSTEGWEVNCTGLIRVKYAAESNPIFNDEEAAEQKRYVDWFRNIESSCFRSIDVEAHYTRIGGIGYNFSGPFRPLTSIQKGDYRSRCDLQIQDTKSMMQGQIEFPHVIHPTTLDGVIQMGIVAATKADEDLMVAAVPTYIQRLYVADEVAKSPGAVLRGCAAIENPGFEHPEQTFVVMDDNMSGPWIIFEGLKSTALRRAELGVAQAVQMRKLVAKLHWREDLDKLDIERVSSMCNAELSKVPQIGRNVITDLEHGAFVFMKRLLSEIRRDEFESLAPHFKQFYRFMEKTYDEVLQGNNPHQQQDGSDWINADAMIEEELLRSIAESSADGAAMYAHGKSLAKIMRGEELAIDTLMQNNRLHDYYQFGVGYAEVYVQLARYVDILAHKNPDMKILEIGGGTGGATLPILQALGGQNNTSPRFAQYTFTDISTGFFEKAGEKFRSWLPWMKFQRLDIEQDPADCGLELGQYDLIVAANVLHATESMDKTLAHVKRFMKPDAKLIMSEITNPQLRIHMVVGSFEGWWAGLNDGREWGPTMSKAQWDTVLKKNGYSGIEIALDDIPDSIDHAYSILVSSANPPKSHTLNKDIVYVQNANNDAELDAFYLAFAHEVDLMGVEVLRLTLGETAAVELAGKTVVLALDCTESSKYLSEITEDDFNLIKRLLLECSNSIWLTRAAVIDSDNPEASMCMGMARSIRAENPTIALTTLDMDQVGCLDSYSNIRNFMKVLSHSQHALEDRRPDWEYAIREEKLFIPRLLPEKGLNDLLGSLSVTPKAELMPFKQQERPLELQITSSGRLETLCFDDDPVHSTPLADDDVEIEVKAVGLNFKDVKVAMGQLQEKYLGLDCSGIVSRVGKEVENVKVGQRVMTWTLGSFKTFARSKASMCLPIPENMNFVTAASIPLVFCTAYYALFHAGNLRKGQTVLIHGAAGGVGQAAIMLAQNVEATIFTTVSTAEKKALLMERYRIPEEHILNSRDMSFAKGVMRLTAGKGVDVILNSLAGDALQASWECIARFGHFIEVGKTDITQNTNLAMAPFARHCTFSSVDLVELLRHDLQTSTEVFKNVMSLFQDNSVHEISPTTSKPFSEIEEAFRLLQTGKHTGKVVLEVHNGDLVPCIPARVKPIQFREDFTYVLSGGTGGLGRSLAGWMADKGAKHIAFLSRSGDRKQEAKDTIALLHQKGVQAQAFACDIVDENAVSEALRSMSEALFPPVKGVIQGAMVIKDTIFPNMTHTLWEAATRPKVQGTYNLHKLLPQDLDFFVMLSSCAGVVGSRGQSNYAAGNTYQDALAAYRKKRGQHGAVIDLGLILDVGYVAESTSIEVQDNARKWSFVGLREKEVHALVQAAITGVSINQSTPVEDQIITGIGTGGMSNLAGFKIPWWFGDAKFAHVRDIDTHQVATADTDDTHLLLTQLGEAETFAAVVEVMSVALVQKLAKSLMIDIEDIDTTKPLSRFGVDSLLAVEIRSWILQELQADISVFQLLSSVPLSTLAADIAEKSKATPPRLTGTNSTESKK